MKIKNLGIAAVAAAFAVGSTGTAVFAVSDDGSAGSSAASITLSDCVIVSSKDISNIEYFASGTLVTKDESTNTRSYDLNTVEGIENIDAVSVKAGTTVETFNITCAPATQPGDGTDGGTPEEEAPEEDGSIEGGSAVIALSGCVLNSTKDISNIAYYSGGTLVTKDESTNTRSYDLNTVAGIENIDTVTVKSSTTVETFNITCAAATQPGDGTDGGETTADNGGGSTVSS